MNQVNMSIPDPIEEIIGRGREISVLESLLQREDVRLITLTGPGGIGKTRLALHAAKRMEEVFADGVRFVALADIPTPNLVSAAIAREIGISGINHDAVPSALRLLLHPLHRLLVLDNFEHLLPSAPVLSDLLAHCPRLKILVTSRSLLRIAGEFAIPLPPLELPEITATSSVETIMESAAVRLFFRRAQSTNPDFELTAQSAPLVADICRQVDGVPLAIELAASRISHLPLAALRQRLDRQLPLLTGGPRDHPPRLQTMQNAISWSYDLLDEPEKTMLRRLSVFTGGMALESAESIFPDAPTPVLDLVASLVNSSLLLAETGQDGTARYRMLAVVQEFAANRLSDSGDTNATGELHANHFLALAERHYPAAYLPAENRSLVLLESDIANLRAAMVWFRQENHIPEFLRLVEALSWFWFIHGHFVDGSYWLRAALDVVDDQNHRAITRLSIALSVITLVQDDADQAQHLVTIAITHAEALADPLELARALITSSVIDTSVSKVPQAKHSLERAVIQAQAIADPGRAAAINSSVLANLGVACRIEGNLDEAAAFHQRALTLQRSVGFERGAYLSMMDLGDVAITRDDPYMAASHYRQGLQLAAEQGESRSVADALDGLASTAVSRGEFSHAVELFSAADALRESSRFAIWNASDASALRHQLEIARASMQPQQFNIAWNKGRTIPLAEAIQIALEPPRPQAPDAHPVLTRREQEVLRLVSAGMTDRQIAENLFISIRTVEHHVASIFRKFGVKTRTAAANIARTAPHTPIEE